MVLSSYQFSQSFLCVSAPSRLCAFALRTSTIVIWPRTVIHDGTLSDLPLSFAPSESRNGAAT
jgi:hypothetical protein